MRIVTAVVLFLLSGLALACSPVPIPTSETRQPKPTPQAQQQPQPTAAKSFSLPNPFSRSTATPAPTPVPKPQVLRINIGPRPDTLDPQKASTVGEVAVLQMAYEGLTRLDQNGRPGPGAADKWEFSPDGKTLTFHLRSGLRRADGTALTAKDFEFAFKHAVDPRLGAIDPSFLNDVHGALAAYSLDPKSKLEDIQKAMENIGVKAADDATLVVTFDQPAGYFPAIAATWVGWPSDPGKVETDPDAWWFKPENHNGNGPFRIVDIQEQVIKFEPNPNYWGRKPKLDRVEFYWIAEPAAALEAYRRGTVDMVRLSSDTLNQARADATLSNELVRGPAAWVTYLGFNVKKAPFTDKNVRKAFSQALDREAFVRDVLKGLGRPYMSWIPPGIPGYDETATSPAYDAQAAVRTLIDSGYGTPDKRHVDCAKLGTVKLSYANTPNNQNLNQFLAGDFTRVFSCPVVLEPLDPTTYAFNMRDVKTAPQIYLIAWQGEYSHPQDWLFLQMCNGVYASRIGYCNKDLDAAITAANAEFDFDKSIDKYQAAQRLYVADGAAAFLWNNENAFLIKPYVSGPWEHHGTGDNAWPGQFGPIDTYSIDTTRVGDGYPAK